MSRPSAPRPLENRLPICAADEPILHMALDALQEVFGQDKGFHEDEWIEWCNRWLHFMQINGRLQYTVGYS